MHEIFSSLDLHSLELSEENFSAPDARTLLVTKWNWEYDKAHRFQKEIVARLSDFPQTRVLIFTNHPRLFTYGRGLQKPKKGQSFTLQDFDLSTSEKLPYPFYKIERGGGLTFHHPGQFVFYPIVRLNPNSLSLSKMIDDILDVSIDVLRTWGLEKLHHENDLLGLWHEHRKLASVGIAIERLTTFHGMALNLISDHQMLQAMQSLNPCGLEAQTYAAVEEFVTLPEYPAQTFSKAFLERIMNVWK